MRNTRKAFGMVETVIVIVIIGILASIAMPKFSATRSDAYDVVGATNFRQALNNLSQVAMMERMQTGKTWTFPQLEGLIRGNISSTYMQGSLYRCNVKLILKAPQSGEICGYIHTRTDDWNKMYSEGQMSAHAKVVKRDVNDECKRINKMVNYDSRSYRFGDIKLVNTRNPKWH